jgi:nicotinate-nucleotide pyrophosphorylase
VDLHTVNAIAQTGVDFISVGKITHSAGVVDLSMKCEV